MSSCVNRALVIVVALTCAGSVTAQAPRPPVIDMHVHSTTTRPARLARLQTLNVRYLFLAGLVSDLRDWQAVDASRYLPALVLPCDGGRAPITGRACFEGHTDLPDIL